MGHIFYALVLWNLTNITSKTYTDILIGVISPTLQIKKMIPGKGWGKGSILNVQVFAKKAVKKVLS